VSSSWDTNATFVTALSAALSISPSVPLPAVIRLADRCWCDVSAPRLFEPFDIARWERASVDQLKDEVERDAARAKQLSSSQGQTDSPNGTSCCSPLGINRTTSTVESVFQLLSHTSTLSTSPEATSTADPADQSSTPAEPQLPNGVPVTPSVDLPLIRRKYDLRSYGFSMILDFGWSRDD
jgi:hypothetical protein